MNTVGVLALTEIRKWPGCEHAVIAGGMCRDELLGVDFSDIDIFVPIPSGRVRDCENVLFKDLKMNPKTYLFDRGSFTDMQWNENGYKDISPNYIAKVDCKFNGVDCDIVGYALSPDRFGDNLVQEFAYDIDKVFYDGHIIAETEEFQNDVRNMTATLSSLTNINGLQRVMHKFSKFNKKYPDYRFRSTCLQVVEKNNNKDNRNIDPGHPELAVEWDRPIVAAARGGGDLWQAAW